MDGGGNYRLKPAIYTNPIPAAVVQPPSILQTLHRCPILLTLPIKNLCVAFPYRITLREPISPATSPAVEPVVEDKSAGPSSPSPSYTLRISSNAPHSNSHPPASSTT